MAAGSKKRFSPQFKAEAVQLVVMGDRMITEVAQELGILPGTLGNWVGKYRRENAVEEVEQPLSVSDRVRLSELEVEVRRLRMENDFLKKQRPSSPVSRSK